MQSLNFMSFFCVWTSVILFVCMWNMSGRKPFWICSNALRGFVLCKSYGFLKLKCNQENKLSPSANLLWRLNAEEVVELGLSACRLQTHMTTQFQRKASQNVEILLKEWEKLHSLWKSFSGMSHCQGLQFMKFNFGLYFSFVLYHQFWNDKWILHVEINTNISSFF